MSLAVIDVKNSLHHLAWMIVSLWRVKVCSSSEQILHSSCLVKNLQISLVVLLHPYCLHTALAPPFCLAIFFSIFWKTLRQLIRLNARSRTKTPIGVRVVCLFCTFMCDCACGFGQHWKNVVLEAQDSFSICFLILSSVSSVKWIGKDSGGIKSWTQTAINLILKSQWNVFKCAPHH